jgi:hypothetical protein
MPGSAQRARRSLASARPSDVAVSLDFFDSYSPVSPIAEPQRPGLRRLVSPDDSARLMFFFGWFCLLPASFMCSLFPCPFRHVLPSAASGPHLEPQRSSRNGYLETICNVLILATLCMPTLGNLTLFRFALLAQAVIGKPSRCVLWTSAD